MQRVEQQNEARDISDRGNSVYVKKHVCSENLTWFNLTGM